MSAERPDRLTLASGGSVTVEPNDGGEVLTVHSREGACVLSILLTDAGPVLRFEAVALHVVTTKSFDVECESFRVHARDQVNVEGRSVGVRANLGSVTVQADDDVSIDGERVLLNSADRPQQLSWDEFLGERKGGS